MAHQFLGGDVRVFNLRHGGGDGFAEVVRGNVGGKAHGDAVGAVDQQIGEAAGQHVRLLLRIVKVEVEAHGVLVDVLQKHLGKLGHARLGVAHRRRAVAVDGAEVAVAVHQRRAHHKGLRHARQRVVDADIAVGVEFTKAIADDAGALAVRLVEGVAQFVHGVEYAALHGL